MNWKSASIYIISSVTEQIKKLCVHNRNNKIKGIIGIWNNNKQCSFPVTNQIQFQFVITHKLPQFRNIKGCESCTTTDQNRFCCLTGGQLVFFVLPYRKMVRVFLLQFIKHQIYWILEILIIFPGFWRINHFQQSIKIFFFFPAFIPDIANQGTIIEFFRLYPKILTWLLPFTFGISNNGCYQF